MVGVGLPDVYGSYLHPYPDMLVVDLLHHLDQHVTLAVTWEVEMPPSGLHISVNISKVLGKPLLQALTCLSYVLLTTSRHPTADEAAQVGGGAVHLRVKVNLVGSGSGLKSWTSLYIGELRSTL